MNICCSSRIIIYLLWSSLSFIFHLNRLEKCSCRSSKVATTTKKVLSKFFIQIASYTRLYQQKKKVNKCSWIICHVPFHFIHLSFFLTCNIKNKNLLFIFTLQQQQKNLNFNHIRSKNNNKKKSSQAVVQE